MLRGFASTVVKWTCITVSWTLRLKLDYYYSREEDLTSEQEIKTVIFIFIWVFYYFYYLLFGVIHQQALA